MTKPQRKLIITIADAIDAMLKGEVDRLGFLTTSQRQIVFDECERRMKHRGK